ncbi:MAG: DUF1018 domain-containing protein [Acidobacteria bacterium]|nr:DUF1018 domain-containing protein [Acidobacteriota bacterium]MCZ6750321.1 DUF1018 domain-containing protein [Acidobacteriota bacterium]
MSQAATGRFRKQRISLRQIQILQTLWSAKLRRTGKRLRLEISRTVQLRQISEIVGHEVDTCKALNWQEANQVIHRLLEELGPRKPIPAGVDAERPSEGAAAVVAEAHPILSPVDAPSASDTQLWKIRQIEQFLGWSRRGGTAKRLAGFLRVKFHVERPEQLAHDQAGRVMEALCAVGARQRIQKRKGKDHAVGKEELAREVSAIKQELDQKFHGRRPE